MLYIIILGLVFSVDCFANEPEREYQIKAAFLYKFLLFAEWPEEPTDESRGTIIIGIIGKDSFGNVFEPIEGEIIDGRKLIIKRFKKDVSIETLKKCHILFISSSLKKEMNKILKPLNEYPVLTVSEIKGFPQTGGMINFKRSGNRIGFEINMSAAESVGIKFRSKLLRVAQRIVEN
jgi:hypothetical protein